LTDVTQAGTSAWAVGIAIEDQRGRSLALRWDGVAWRDILVPGAVLLNAVAATGGATAAVQSAEGATVDADDVAVGYAGRIVAWDGSKWASAASPISDTLHAVAIAPDGAVWAAGANGRVLELMRSGGWRERGVSSAATIYDLAFGTPSEGASTTGWAVGCMPCESAAGPVGAVWRWDGSALQPDGIEGASTLFGVAVDADGVVAVGDGGQLWRRSFDRAAPVRLFAPSVWTRSGP
jgi:hypothetical protein